MTRRTFAHLGKLILLFFIYFVAGKFGLSFDAVSHFATLLWIPSGVSLAALLIFGYSLWPAITIAAFYVNFTTGADFFIALGIATGNTLEVVIGTYLLKATGFDKSYESLKDVLLIAFVASPFASIISATIGVTSLFLGGNIALSGLNETWTAWWIGDAISILILTPFCLTWRISTIKRLRGIKIIEAGLLLLFTIIVLSFVFQGLITPSKAGDPLTYFLLLPLIWAALGFGQRGALTSVVGISLFAIIATIQGLGPFAQGRLSFRLANLQGFIGLSGFTAMVIAAIESERQKMDGRKDEFISLASHELKTPLTSIKVFNQLLQKTLTKSSQKQGLMYIHKIDKQVDALTVLINSLLDISKIQIGELEQHKEYFSLPEFIDDTVETIRETTQSHTLVIKKFINKKPVIVYADRERINQILINLLNNAFKYSPKGSKVIITIKTRKTEAIVSVRDFGMGIDKDNIRKIFELYFRGQTDMKKQVSGLGIGLYISYKIIKLSNGRMWVESKIGKGLPAGRQGSTFYFSLPVQKKAHVVA